MRLSGAPIGSVLTALGYDADDPIRKCSETQLRDVSNLSRVFTIVGSDAASLTIMFDSRLRDDLDDKTVYVVRKILAFIWALYCILFRITYRRPAQVHFKDEIHLLE